MVYEVRGFLEETWRSRGGEPDSDFYRWSRDAETACMVAADAVVTLAETMRQEIVSRGVDTVFGTVTTLNDYEGVDTLVHALAELDDPGVRLLVVGDGPARSTLERLAAPLGARVVFTGRVPHARVPDHLAAIDVFCVPRRATPVTVLVPPLKPLEAMAAGRPVLASDLPPLVETVRPGEFGAVAPAGDPSAWAEQMSLLRYAPDDARTMGERAREWIAEHRTWAAAAERYGAVYAQVASGGPAPGTSARPGPADRPDPPEELTRGR